MELKNKLLEAFSEFLEKAVGSTQNLAPVSEVLTKAVDLEQRMALFIVLEPDTVDAHGDIYTGDEVEKACHSFNNFCNKAYLFHKFETEDAVILESYIAPTSFILDNGQSVSKGSWLQLWSFPDTDNGEEIWKNVKSGEFSGVSIGARAKVEYL